MTAENKSLLNKLFIDILYDLDMCFQDAVGWIRTLSYNPWVGVCDARVA